MPTISQAPKHRTTMHGRRAAAALDQLVYPLVFSLTGLLANALALMAPSEGGWLVLLRLALVAAAPPLAAMVGMDLVGDADDPYP